MMDRLRVDEEAAKRAWLAKQDRTQPSWGRAKTAAPAVAAPTLSEEAKEMVKVQEQIEALQAALDSYKEFSMEPAMINAFLMHCKAVKANL
jgi:hypothetical protein